MSNTNDAQHWQYYRKPIAVIIILVQTLQLLYIRTAIFNLVDSIIDVVTVAVAVIIIWLYTNHAMRSATINTTSKFNFRLAVQWCSSTATDYINTAIAVIVILVYTYIQMMRWCSSTATDYIRMMQLLMLSYSYNCSCGYSDNYPTMYNCSAVIAILMFQTLQLIISTLSAVL